METPVVDQIIVGDLKSEIDRTMSNPGGNSYSLTYFVESLNYLDVFSFSGAKISLIGDSPALVIKDGDYAIANLQERSGIRYVCAGRQFINGWQLIVEGKYPDGQAFSRTRIFEGGSLENFEQVLEKSQLLAL